MDNSEIIQLEPHEPVILSDWVTPVFGMTFVDDIRLDKHNQLTNNILN